MNRFRKKGVPAEARVQDFSCRRNSGIIDLFLADQLDPEQQSAFEQHLNECDDCCRELQRRTAEAEIWQDARKFLSSTDNVPIDPDSPSENDGTANAETGDRLRLDFLGPTDDPRMLGRIGCYEISGVIGCGGMGLVLKAFDPPLNRYSAIKVLSPHYASCGAARQRFAREAAAAAAVVHDNVIAIHGVDEYNGLPYLVMPYIKGESLQKRIDRNGPLAVAEILRIAMQTARGLSAAHDQGLVHRDIKPGNILLPSNVERVLITDFGLARAADDASLTRSGVIAGTPQYMSPEQARGEGIDARSDLFSLGSVLYAMCTGHPPFRAETPYGILRRITDNEARPLREVNPEIPLWLCEIVERLLEKDAARRFATAEAVATLLERCLAHVQQPTVVPLPAGLSRTDKSVSHRHIVIVGTITAALIGTAACLLWHGVEWNPRPDNARGSVNTANVFAGKPEQFAVVEAVTHADNPSVVEGEEPDLEWESDAGLLNVEKTLEIMNREFNDDRIDELNVELDPRGMTDIPTKTQSGPQSE